jgi:glutaredoxin 3
MGLRAKSRQSGLVPEKEPLRTGRCLSIVPAILYVKEGCPWCEDAETELQKLGVKYERREVRSNPAFFQEMKAVSGQSKAPVLDIDGRILADFGVEQLPAFLKDS